MSGIHAMTFSSPVNGHAAMVTLEWAAMANTTGSGKRPILMLSTEGKSKEQMKAEAREALQKYKDAQKRNRNSNCRCPALVFSRLPRSRYFIVAPLVNDECTAWLIR